MYFLRLKPLKEELVAGPLPGRQRFAYLLAWTILWVLLPFFGLPSSTPLKLVLFLGCLIIAIFGIRYVHRRNGGADGPALLDRFTPVFPAPLPQLLHEASQTFSNCFLLYYPVTSP